MTISTTASVATFLGNGATTNFVFSFVADNASDISVVFTDTDGAQNVLSPSQYTLVINAPAPGELWGTGGTVIYPLVGSPIASGTTLSVVRDVPYTQDVSIGNQGAFYPQAVEEGLDVLELQIQQVVTDNTYALKTPVTDVTPPNVLPSAAERANMLLGFDSQGQPVVVDNEGGGGGGSVTSVGLSMPAEFFVTGSPVTTSGTLTVTKASESENTFYAGPTTGSPAQPAFRAIVPADLPVATSGTLGVVKPDNISVTISTGTISVPTATSSTLGLVKPDNVTVTISGGVLSATGSGTITKTGTPVSGNLTKWSGTTSVTNGDLSGDVTTSGGLTTALSTTGVSPGSYGDSTHIPTFVVDTKGRISSASNNSITIPVGANPTGTAGPTAVNGVATTFMRSDGAPAVQLGSNSQKGIVQVDGTTITASSGIITANINTRGAMTFWIEGTVTSSEVVASVPTVIAYSLKTTDVSSWQASSDTASTGTAVFTMKKNGSSIGTVTFTSSTTGVFSFLSNTSFAIGDNFSLTGPGSADLTLANIRFGFIVNV